MNHVPALFCEDVPSWFTYCFPLEPFCSKRYPTKDGVQTSLMETYGLPKSMPRRLPSVPSHFQSGSNDHPAFFSEHRKSLILRRMPIPSCDKQRELLGATSSPQIRDISWVCSETQVLPQVLPYSNCRIAKQRSSDVFSFPQTKDLKKSNVIVADHTFWDHFLRNFLPQKVGPQTKK